MIFFLSPHTFDDQDFLINVVDYGGQGLYVVEALSTSTMIVAKAVSQ